MMLLIVAYHPWLLFMQHLLLHVLFALLNDLVRRLSAAATRCQIAAIGAHLRLLTFNFIYLILMIFPLNSPI